MTASGKVWARLRDFPTLEDVGGFDEAREGALGVRGCFKQGNYF